MIKLTPIRRFFGWIAPRLFIGGAMLSVGMFLSCGNSNQQHTPAETASGSSSVIEEQSPRKTVQNILIFGNSLTAGYGLDEPGESFPSIIQQKIDSLGLPYHVINAGLSGETSAAGNERIDWLLNEEVSIFILELGANDGLRGLPISATRKNLQSIIDKVVSAYPDAKLVLAGMLVPPNMGEQYADDFATVFPELAAKNNMALIPFLLDSVAGDPALNLNDGIHPNARGQQIVAENVWQILAPLL